MEPFAWAIILKPFLLVLYLLPGAALAWYLRKRMPDCGLKRILFYSWRV